MILNFKGLPLGVGAEESTIGKILSMDGVLCTRWSLFSSLSHMVKSRRDLEFEPRGRVDMWFGRFSLRAPVPFDTQINRFVLHIIVVFHDK